MTSVTSRYSILLPLMTLSLTVLLAPAYAQMTCPTEDLLDHLPTCVTHHYTMGDIDNQGIYQSLLTKANNAVALNEQGNSEAAVNLLHAFINELEAQRGNHLTTSAADMLIMHAEMAITEISG